MKHMIAFMNSYASAQLCLSVVRVPAQTICDLTTFILAAPHGPLGTGCQALRSKGLGAVCTESRLYDPLFYAQEYTQELRT